jgi:hypothetical protein
MKKIVLTLIILFFPFLNYGQKWNLVKLNPENIYKFEYWFSFQNDDDNNYYDLVESQTKTEKRKLNGILINKNDEAIQFAKIEIRDINNKIISTSFSNFNGEFSIENDLENFEVSISASYYDKFISKIISKKEFDTNLKVKLGKAPELIIYQIISKTEFTAEEIMEIINCVKSNREIEKEKFIQICSNKNKYLLSIQI